jgi:phosphoglycerate dehydrogenase-like enzyme
MTPHVSGVTDRFWDREMALLEGNWMAYANGRPMTNVIDRQAGY